MIATSVKILELPNLPLKGDVSDWLAAGGTAEQLLALAAAAPEWEPGEESAADANAEESLPEVQLPGGARTISDTASALAKLFAVKQTHFVRGGAVVRVASDEHGHPLLAPVRPAEMASDCEHVATLVKMVQGEAGPEARPTTCSESAAKLIMAARAFVEELPPLKVLSRCPVLVERNGELVEVVGYDRQGGILTEGPQPASVSLSEASHLLDDLLSGFRFATSADRSRAMAALITPGLVLGGLLPGRAPVDLGEADQSQTGKGFRNKVTAAIYRHTPVAISQQHSGVGGLEEAFDRALIAGKTFIAIDNVRGKVDSQKIESFLTEDTYYARAAYLPNTEIDPRRVYVMFTSNKADMTTDLANRSSCVRILKQPDGYQFPAYAEGDVLQHVRARQPAFLGAVFAVIKAWHSAGKPRTDETRHDFRVWAQTLDWIVQHLLGCGPLMDGHRETQRRMTNPSMNWLRDVAIAAVQQGREGQWLIAADILEVIDANGVIEVPGLKSNSDLEDEGTRKAVWQQIGRKLTRCFGDQDRVELDQLVVDRECTTDAEYRQRRHYRVCQKATESDPAIALSERPEEPSRSPQTLFDNVGLEQETSDPAINPANSPLMTPLVNPRDPANPANVSNNKRMCGRGREALSETLGSNSGVSGVSGVNDQPLPAAIDPAADREVVLI